MTTIPPIARPLPSSLYESHTSQRNLTYDARRSATEGEPRARVPSRRRPSRARGLGVFSPNDAAGNLSYAPFGGFSTAPPPPERAAVSALGGAEFIPRTSSAGSFGGIGIVQDDAPPRHDGPSTLGGAEFVPGAGLVPGFAENSNCLLLRRGRRVRRVRPRRRLRERAARRAPEARPAAGLGPALGPAAI